MTEQQYKEKVYAEAREVKTNKELTKFLDSLKDYNHDYGTIVYACMAAMKAAFRVVNDSPHGGITGFQAGCLGWECVREFMMVKEGALKLVQYDDLLYPQMAYKFEKIITPAMWSDLKNKAKDKLLKTETAHPDVTAHWQSIAQGRLPFGFTVKEEQ